MDQDRLGRFISKLPLKDATARAAVVLVAVSLAWVCYLASLDDVASSTADCYCFYIMTAATALLAGWQAAMSVTAGSTLTMIVWLLTARHASAGGSLPASDMANLVAFVLVGIGVALVARYYERSKALGQD